jgi:hypothetical protein
MKTTITLHEFRDTFRKMGRENSFSYEGFEALFNWIEEFEESTGIESEFDPIGLDCDFVEYENLEEFHENYEKEDFPDLEAIEENTIVIPVNDDAFIIQAF